MGTELTELTSDVMVQLAPARRQLVASLVAEYGASPTFAFTLALLAAGTVRERQLVRLLLRQLDELPPEGREAGEDSTATT